MDLTVDHIIDVARKGNRIDPPYQRDAIKILFTKEPGDMDAQALKQLLAVYSEEFGVRLKIIGGGPGCTYFVIDGKPSNNLLDLLTSDEFIRGISKLGAKIIWSDEPGVRLPIDRFMDESIQSRADFAILTPLIEEFKPLKEALKAASCRGEIRIQNPNSTMTYYQYDLQSFSGTIHRVVATFMQRMGNDSAAITTVHTLNDWRPKHILLGGIAGGVDSSEVSLGDVVVADEIFRYDRRRKERDTGTTWAPSAYPTDRLLLNRSLAFKLEDECMREWASECQEGGFESMEMPRVHIGNIACGDAVVDSVAMKNKLLELNRTLAAIEMEGGGFLEAVINQSAVARALVVRGISDYAAEKSGTDSGKIDWRAYASSNVAKFIVSFVQQFQTVAYMPQDGDEGILQPIIGEGD